MSQHFEWLRVVPIDESLPYSVRIDEVRVAPAKFSFTVNQEPTYSYEPVFGEVPIYEYGVIDEIVTTETVATGYVEKDIPQSALRN